VEPDKLIYSNLGCFINFINKFVIVVNFVIYPCIISLFVKLDIYRYLKNKSWT